MKLMCAIMAFGLLYVGRRLSCEPAVCHSAGGLVLFLGLSLIAGVAFYVAMRDEEREGAK
jgi:hypothetical protein